MIAQADSRKWMACLYNSFLFMEAKIMKMAKKLLALVLTGVMAVSMLTGCALSDRAAANALEKTYIKVGTKDYAYIVIGAPKTSDDSHAENWTVSKLHGTSGVIYDTALKTVSEGGSTYTVKNAEKSTTATKAKVNFGVKLVNDGAESNKNYYAVVVVELTKNS